jgi:hypothetical protein
MAAKPKSTSSTNAFKPKSRKKRPGVHAKTKTSKGKGSPNYKKPYNRQGR